MKTITEYLDAIRLKIKDGAGEIFKAAVVSAAAYSSPNTTFTLDTVEGFFAGDNVYFRSASGAQVIISVDSELSKIVVTGNLVSANPAGTELFRTEANQHLDESLQVYSTFKPRRLAQDLTYVANGEYDMPDNWQEGFSQIKLIENPIGDIPLSKIPTHLFLLSYDEAGEPYIFIIEDAGVTGNIRVHYTMMHTVLTAPESAFYCICNLSAAKCLLALASYYGQGTSSTISADTTDTQNKVDAYRRLAKEYLGQAALFLGISLKELESGTFTQGASSIDQEIPSLNSRGSRLNRNSFPIIT